MPQKLEKLRRFFKELQRSDTARKKRWLIGATILSMLIVLMGWFVYINTVGVPAIAQREGNLKVSEEGQSTWQIFKRGLGDIFNDAKEQLEISRKAIEEQLRKTNEVIIENQPTQ